MTFIFVLPGNKDSGMFCYAYVIAGKKRNVYICECSFILFYFVAAPKTLSQDYGDEDDSD